MIRKALPILVIILLAGCLPVGQIDVTIVGPTPTASATTVLPVPSDTPVPTATIVPSSTPLPTNTATNLPDPTATSVPPTPTPEADPEEILILAPGPGSRLTSPLTISGEADSTFEQHLVIRLVLADGTELALLPTIIQTPMGERGPFEAQVEFTVTGEQQAFIQVYSTSARDGGITHLSSVGVILADSGPVDIRPPFTTDEWIRIDAPTANAMLPQSGTIHVEGFGYASFEQTLIIELLDTDGNVIASVPIIVQAPDLGQPGPWSADLEYSAGYPGPGRIVVRDPSAAFNGDVHLASIEVTFTEN